MSQKISVFLMFFWICFGFSQNDEKFFRATVICENNPAEAVTVFNTTQHFTAISNANGQFVIPLQVGDVLRLSAVNLETKELKISIEIINTNNYQIGMTKKVQTLEEVKVIDYGINAKSLGILDKSPKDYTPAERKLYFVTGNKHQIGLNTKISLERIISGISGKTKKLKKEVIVERKERAIAIINELFTEQYFTDILHIPQENVKGFHYFAVEDESLFNAILNRNTLQSEFIFANLAPKFLEALHKK